MTGLEVDNPLSGHTRRVHALAALPWPDERTLLVTVSDGTTVRMWDPVTGTQVGDTVSGHTGVVTAITTVPLPQGRNLLATASQDETVRVWDPVTATQVGTPLSGHNGPVNAVVALPLPDGRALLATGEGGGLMDHEATVRLWDPATSSQVGKPLTGHSKPVSVMAAMPLPDGRTLLASGGHDTTLRLWDPIACSQVGALLPGHSPLCQPLVRHLSSADY